MILLRAAIPVTAHPSPGRLGFVAVRPSPASSTRNPLPGPEIPKGMAAPGVHMHVTSFTELGLLPELLRAVADAGYTTPTPIQVQAIPVVLQGRDVMGG